MRADRIVLLLLGFIGFEGAAPTMSADHPSECAKSKLKWVFILSPRAREMNFPTNSMQRTRLASVEKPERGSDNVRVIIEPEDFHMFKETTKAWKVYKSHSWRCINSSKRVSPIDLTKGSLRPKNNSTDNDTRRSSRGIQRFSANFVKNWPRNKSVKVDGATFVGHRTPPRVLATSGKTRRSAKKTAAQNQRNSVEKFRNHGIGNFAEMKRSKRDKMITGKNYTSKNNAKKSTGISRNETKRARSMKRNRTNYKQKLLDLCGDESSHCYSIRIKDCCGNEDQVKVSSLLRNSTKHKSSAYHRRKKHKPSAIVGSHESILLNESDLAELPPIFKKYREKSTTEPVQTITPIYIPLLHEEYSTKDQNSAGIAENFDDEHVKLSEIPDDDESYVPLDDIED